MKNITPILAVLFPSIILALLAIKLTSGFDIIILIAVLILAIIVVIKIVQLIEIIKKEEGN